MTYLGNLPLAPAMPEHPTTPMPWIPELIFTIFLGTPVLIGLVLRSSI